MSESFKVSVTPPGYEERTCTLGKHPSGQWQCKRHGKTHYFGRDKEVAECRALIMLCTGIKPKSNKLRDFAKEYLTKIGFDDWDELYAALWTSSQIDDQEGMENVSVWFSKVKSFLAMDKSRRVYLVEDSEGDVKIGYAKNVRSRFQNLQTANKRPLRLLLTLPGGEPHEQELHREFRSDRISGEWFKRNESVDSYIRMLQSIDLV